MRVGYRFLCAAAALIAVSADLAAQGPKRIFPETDTNFSGESVYIPADPFTYEVIFREGESMVKNKAGQSALARGNHDFTAYIPIQGSSEHGWIVINHELRDSNSSFGDGGGMTVFEVRRTNGRWGAVGDFRNVDFSEVGGTWNNCGGAQTPYGTALTAEESPPSSNNSAFSNGRQIRDTSDVTITFDGEQRTIPRYMNYGWMVEVDPVTAKATRKLWKMGRYAHEGGYCMPDGRTVYLTDDFENAVLFKFVATTPNDYSDGQLYAYRQSADGESGSWLALPMEFDSLAIIRDVAIRMGATLFIRHEWVTEANGKIYITETGRDEFSWAEAVAMGGVPAKHMEAHRIGETGYEYEDFYGRIIELDPATGRIRVVIEGGTAKHDRFKNLASPDGLVTVTLNGRQWLVVNEDLNGRSMNRVSPEAEAANRTIGEIYFIDPTKKNLTVDDAIRFLVGPNGAETTGGVFTPNAETYFVNIQHPSGSNPAPFNKSATIAVTGFEDYIVDEFELFEEIDTNFVGQTVIVPAKPYRYKVLFREGESMVKNKNGQTALARGNHDFTGLIPIGGATDRGWVIVNHELRDSNSSFGDGGGMTVFEVRRTGYDWNVVGDFRNVDFSTVGGTFVNCGGAQTPFGHVLTAEEFPPASNADAYASGRQIRDTSDVTVTFNGQQRTIPRYMNYGWMVEVDPANARAVQKLWKMGRYSHEGGYCTPDGRTVYLTDDNEGAVLFKFVATTPNDYSDGQLYAYKQSADGESGSWIALPMEFDSLANARNVALRRGATIFIRHEWLTEASNGKIYLTETGLDAFSWENAVAMGGVPARHMEAHRIGETGHEYEDFYGRIIELDPATGRIRVYLEGGNAAWDPAKNLSNPDGLVMMNVEGKEYFVINEDLNGRSMNRVSPEAEAANRIVGEIYFLDATIENPTVDDLQRFLIAPNGAETTGGRPTADGSTYFVNIQHPSRTNPPPFDKSATIAVTGFNALTSVPAVHGTNPSGFRIFPNPATQTLTFNVATDITVVDASGRVIATADDATTLDVSTFAPGTYFIRNGADEVQKLIVQ